MKKNIKARFYNDYYFKHVPIKELRDVDYVYVDIFDEAEPHSTLQLYSYTNESNGRWFEKEGFSHYRIWVRLKNKDAVTAILNNLSMKHKWQKTSYVKKENPDMTLFSGWRTGRKTKITAEDLPDNYVKLMNYKKSGYLKVTDVVDAKFFPSKIKMDGMRDDMLILSYDKKLPESYKMSEIYKIDNIDLFFGTDICIIAEGIKKYSGIDILDQVNSRIEEIRKYNRKES